MENCNSWSAMTVRLRGAECFLWRMPGLRERTRTTGRQRPGRSGSLLVTLSEVMVSSSLLWRLQGGQTVDHDGFVNPVHASITISGYSKEILERWGDGAAAPSE